MSAPAVAVSMKHQKSVVAWKDMRNGEPNVYWSVSGPAAFEREQPVHDTTKGTQDHPSVAIDSGGGAWVAWEDSRSGRQEIFVRSEREPSGRVISSGPAPTAFPCLASGSGLVAVVFEAGRGEDKRVGFRVVQRD